ncbi:MAG: hypothetical protein IPH62_03445 [Ignavibacteriae bacterium]|nr:hypothetical protein [Ignavibacteriota bacterium]
MKKNFSLYIILFSILIIFSCTTIQENSNFDKNKFKIIDEVEPEIIHLTGEISGRNSEISGMCWYNDFLLLVPQYPNFISQNENGIIYFIKKSEVLDYLFAKITNEISPKTFKINLSNLGEFLNSGSGFEAISVINDIIYLSIESMNDGKMRSLIISGEIDTTNFTISLDKNSVSEIPTSVEIYNLSCEAIASKNDTIIPIYEANGKNVNPKTFVNIFNNKLEILEKVKFPNLEYRITDATEIDENGNFWTINYFFPKDEKKLNPANDEIFSKFGIGETHQNAKVIERIVEFEIKNERISISDKNPIYLKLLENDSRNWEGLAKLDEKGFLLITDTFPKTIFAFIPYNFSK